MLEPCFPTDSNRRLQHLRSLNTPGTRQDIGLIFVPDFCCATFFPIGLDVRDVVVVRRDVLRNRRRPRSWRSRNRGRLELLSHLPRRARWAFRRLLVPLIGG